MTLEERVDQINAMLHDEELALTDKEKVELIYHWMRFEYSLSRLRRQEKRYEKRAKWLDNITEIYNMRKDLERTL